MAKKKPNQPKPQASVQAQGDTKQKEAGIEIEGVVKEALKGKFRVEIPAASPGGEAQQIIAHIAGKLRKNYIKIVPGDKVRVEVSPYDISKGRITFRLK